MDPAPGEPLGTLIQKARITAFHASGQQDAVGVFDEIEEGIARTFDLAKARLLRITYSDLVIQVTYEILFPRSHNYSQARILARCRHSAPRPPGSVAHTTGEIPSASPIDFGRAFQDLPQSPMTMSFTRAQSSSRCFDHFQQKPVAIRPEPVGLIADQGIDITGPSPFSRTLSAACPISTSSMRISQHRYFSSTLP